MEPWRCSKENLLSAQVWVVLWRQIHTGHSHTHSYHTAHSRPAPSPVMSLWCHLLLHCFPSMLLCYYCSIICSFPQLTAAADPSHGNACPHLMWEVQLVTIQPCLHQSRQLWVTWGEAAGGHAGGWKSRGWWDTAHQAEWHSCLFLFTRQCWLCPWQLSHLQKSCASPCGKR